MSAAEDVVRRLADLVSFDTQNPTGNERPLVEKLAADLRTLGARAVETFEASGHHAVFAVFGEDTPRLLLNAHVDTVPANTGYTNPPHHLVERGGCVFGLGAADTKGAIAAILDALSDRTLAGKSARGIALLFSGDEERSNTVARAFLASKRALGLRHAIVCEPTGLAVGSRHRGIGVAEVTATSPGGHSSRADEMNSPIVTLARAAVALDAMGQRHRAFGPPGFNGLCMNVASIDGGLAANVIPSRATLTASLRPAPQADVLALLQEAETEVRRATSPTTVEWKNHTVNPSFATNDLTAFAPWLGDRVLHPIDLGFWTEAALFAEASIDAVVFGPGDIRQAHGADEYVQVEQLVLARKTFLQMIGSA